MSAFFIVIEHGTDFIGFSRIGIFAFLRITTAYRGSAAIYRFVSKILLRARRDRFLRPATGGTRKDCVHLGLHSDTTDCFVLADFVGASSQGRKFIVFLSRYGGKN